MATVYTIEIASPDGSFHAVDSRARRDSAIRVADELLEPYRIVTTGGKVVYQSLDPQEETPVQEKIDLDELPELNVADVKQKITELLTAAEDADSQSEQDSLNDQAVSLMVTLRVLSAEQEAAGKAEPEPIVRAHHDWHGNYSITFVPFANELADAFGGLLVTQKTYSAVLRRTSVVGHETDVELFLALLRSMEKQALFALHCWQVTTRSSRKGMSDMQKFLMHRETLAAFGRQAANRVAIVRAEEERHASDEAKKVLENWQSRVRVGQP